MATNLHDVVVTEVSLVDKGANQHAHVLLYKSDGDAIPDEVEAYLKRDFSAEARKDAAKTGAAMPDGSFPIENTSDLHNAVRAIGRAKDPTAARRHIISRAKALGATGSLPDDWKVSKSEFEVAAEAFHKAIVGVLGDDVEKIAAVNEYADEFRKHVDGVLPSTSKGTNTMTTPDPVALLAKAEADKAQLQSEVSVLKSILSLSAPYRDYVITKNLTGDSLAAFVKKTDKEKDAEMEDEKDKMEKRALASLPEAIRKQLEDGQKAAERIAKMEDEAALVAFGKRATDAGLPETEGVTLQKAHGGDAEAITKLLGFIKGLNEQVRVGGLFKTYGSSPAQAGGTAYDQITAAAQELMKADSKLSLQQARVQIMKSKHPDHVKLVQLHKRESAVTV
jgi:hypothetical protein